MNNKVIGVIVAIIVIAAAIFLFTRNGGKNANQTESETTQTNTTASEESKPESMSLKDLAARGGNQTCTFESNDPKYPSQGTVYTAGGKFRGDFSTTVDGKTTASHMISDGATGYMWVDGMNTGFKMDLSAAANANTNAQQSFDASKKYDYDCKSWSADNSKFELPSGVTFTALGQSQATMPAGSTGSSTDYCANLPEPAKSQCYSAR